MFPQHSELKFENSAIKRCPNCLPPKSKINIFWKSFLMQLVILKGKKIKNYIIFALIRCIIFRFLASCTLKSKLVKKCVKNLVCHIRWRLEIYYSLEFFSFWEVIYIKSKCNFFCIFTSFFYHMISRFQLVVL